jgi:hypothetical protein
MNIKYPALLALFCAPLAHADLFINEIHYDNAGGDTGEAIEIAGPADTNLSGWSLVLYNGSNGTVYHTESLTGTIANQQGGMGTVSFNISGIQNGAPDGIALFDGIDVAQFISYEGSFTAMGGVADGMTSTDIGVSESSGTAVGESLQLSGTGTVYSDFTWNGATANTFGNVNTDQTFGDGVIPPPPPPPPTPPTGSGVVFISEYIEGSSFNKAIELYNPTANDIDLAAGNYVLNRYSNGGTTAAPISLTGVIPANGTYVVANNQANDDILSKTDQESGSISHNGDDDYVLTADGEVLDAFGQVGFDPGSSWGTGEFITVNNTLIRNPNVYSGDTITDDVFDPSIEWTGRGNNNSEDLGMHTILPRNLFISEYIEGSSFNKAIELYNPSGVSVDLAAEGYQLERYSNGGTTPSTIDLTGTVAGGDVFVIAHPSSIDAILAQADQTSFSISHNGDDAYVLVKGDEVIDSFGRVGEDPGSQWESNGVGTQNATLVRLSSIGVGDTVVDDEFLPDVEWKAFPSDTTSELGSHEFGGGDDGGDDDVVIGVCTDPATFISAIQGAGDASPLNSETVVVEALVSASYPGLEGFYLQEQAIDYDADSNTSEGLFISYSNDGGLPAVGSTIRVLGTVSENFGRTQLNVSDMLLDCELEPTMVTAIPFSLPFASVEQAESMEGMLVFNQNDLTVTDNFNLGRFGEVALSSERLFIPTNQHVPGSPEAIAQAATNALNKVVMDDGLSVQNPEPVVYPTGGLSASNTLRSGDMVTAIIGPLDYAFSSYRIHPIQPPTIVATNVREPSPAITRGNITVASLNVLNLFNGDGLGGGFPTSRGADTPFELERQIVKTVAAIAEMDADIIGLMEIENDGFDPLSTIAELTDRLNAVTADGTYAFVSSDGPIGTDAIAVGLLYKPASVSLVGDVQLNLDEIFNRPPMAQTFAAQNGAEITVVVNHFKSKGCGGATDDDTDQLDGQGCYNAKRTAQSQTLAAWLATNPMLSDKDNVLIMGDLNAYAKEDPIAALENEGFVNLISTYQGADAYSYTFGGQLGYLDHALASASLLEQTVDAIEWHINADEPRILDYNEEFKSDAQVISFYAPDVFRMSDHDPVMISFDLTPPPVFGDLDGDRDVDYADMRALIMLIRARDTSLDLHDINDDGFVNTRDVSALRRICTRSRCAM